MKYFFLTLFSLGMMIPLACMNTTPTSTGSRAAYATATPLNLSPTPSYISSISATGPNGLAYSSGFIYVAEGDGASVSQVQVYNSTTNTLTSTWTESGSTLFQGPSGIAVNSAGTSIYILDVNPSTDNGTVYAMVPTAVPTPITSWTSYSGTTLSYPGGIAVNSTTGNVYVADTANYQLEEFSSTGSAVALWTGNGDVAPSAVAIDSNSNIYVADGQNYELWELTVSGSTFTVKNSWYLPDIPYTYQDYIAGYGLALDSNASPNIYVADYFNGQVEVYNNSGTQIGLFTGTGTGTLSGPDGILINGSDIYVADYDTILGSGAGLIDIFGPNTY